MAQTCVRKCLVVEMLYNKPLSNSLTEYIINPEIGIEFDDVQEAYEYYNLYSWEVGFGIRRGKTSYSNDKHNRKLPDKERYQLAQEFNCSCAVSL